MEVCYDNPAGAAPPAGRYSQVAKVDLGTGSLVFIAGQVPVTPAGELVGQGDVVRQTQQVFENIKALLAAHGGELRHLVKITTYLVDMSHRGAVGQARNAYLSDPPPTSTLVAISALANPEWLIEVDAIAAIPGPPNG